LARKKPVRIDLLTERLIYDAAYPYGANQLKGGRDVRSVCCGFGRGRAARRGGLRPLQGFPVVTGMGRRKAAFWLAVGGTAILANFTLELAARYVPSIGFQRLVSFIHCGPGSGSNA
jgi:hypothetical protein